MFIRSLVTGKNASSLRIRTRFSTGLALRPQAKRVYYVHHQLADITFQVETCEPILHGFLFRRVSSLRFFLHVFSHPSQSSTDKMRSIRMERATRTTPVLPTEFACPFCSFKDNLPPVLSKYAIPVCVCEACLNIPLSLPAKLPRCPRSPRLVWGVFALWVKVL